VGHGHDLARPWRRHCIQRLRIQNGKHTLKVGRVLNDYSYRYVTTWRSTLTRLADIIIHSLKKKKFKVEQIIINNFTVLVR
jgi:hypothetical protein